MENLVMTLVVVVLIGVFTALIIFFQKRQEINYDERQIIARGKAYRTALFSAVLYMLICAFLALNEIYWAEIAVQMFLGIIFAAAVFAFVAIVKDAFLTINNGGNLSVILCFFVAVMLTVSAVREIIGGKKIVENGMLTDMAIPFVFGFLILAVAVTMIVKKIHNKRSEEM